MDLSASNPIPIPYTRMDQLPFNRHADFDPRNRRFTAAEEEKKMKNNSRKALEEHRVEKWSSYYPKAPERIGRELLESPLKITPYFSLKKGLHERVEDCLVCTESDEYYLAAVLDGYRGDSVALMAKERFRTKFLPLIHGAYRGLPFQAFTRFLDILHSEVQDQDAGSMLVASLVEKATGHLFTATLGDPEAYNFQASETSYNVIPKSCKRNWTYPKEAIRAAHFLEKPSIVSEWTCQKDAKEIRFGFSYQSTHISRGIGNRLLSGNRECPGILWKPKITSGQLLAGDFHLLGSHSLYHLLSIGEIVDHVNRFSHCENPAEDLTSLALSRMNDSSSEDIAALFLKVS